MRNEGTGWDPKGAALVHTARAVLDAAGTVTAWEFTTKASGECLYVNTNCSKPSDTLTGEEARRGA